MSSFPGRIESINETIVSLVNQSRRVDAILIIVPHEVKRVNVGPAAELGPIVEQIVKENNGLVKIVRTEDWGPATKLLGALTVEEDPETVIITVDDDTTYHPHLVLGLTAAIQAHPNNAPCYVCERWPILLRLLGIGPIYQFWEGSCKGWANAYKGVAYKVGWFGEEIWDYSLAPSGCKLHDDVWISGNLMRRGVRPYVLQPGFDMMLAHRRHPTLSVNAVPNTEKDYRDPCVRHFNWFS